MYNKQGRQFRSANSVNSQATALGNIFRSWGNLPQGIRDFWNGIAPLYPQKDKFGNDILLTGRQLYTKLNAQLLPAQRTVDISVFTDVLSAPLVTSILFDISSQSCEIFFENEVLNSYLLLRVYPLRSGSNAVVQNTSKFIFCLLLNEVVSLGITEAVLEKFPFAKAGDRFGVNVIFMNSSGFRSNVQSFVIIAT